MYRVARWTTAPPREPAGSLGGAIGLALALGATRVLSDLLFGISPLDPIAFGLTIVTVVAVALVATCVPARRAASVSPIAALKVD